MNKINKNSLIITSIISIIYILNYIRPDLIIYNVLASVVIIAIFAKYLFDFRLKLEYFFKNFKFILLPILFNVSALSYISYVYISLGRLLLSTLVILANYYLFISLKKVKNLSERAAIFYRNILILVSFFTVFMSSSMLFRILMSISDKQIILYTRLGLVAAIFILIYFIMYFLTWEKGALESRYRTYALVVAFLCTEIAWISSVWSINYPVIGNSEKATLGGTPIGSIVVTITYYFLWGVISHKLDKNLSKKVLSEYLVFTLVFFVILFVTAKWLPIS